MNYLDAVLLGIVEGLTEFLPISSTGHLIIAQRLLIVPPPPPESPEASFMTTFTIVIQFGAIAAVMVLYWRTLLQNWRVQLRVLAAFIPTGVIGLLFHGPVRALLGNETIVVPVILWALLVGGNAIVIFEVLHGERKDAVDGVEQMKWWQAIAIGLFQALALVPGVSRSAATVLGGLAVGLNRRTIVLFSFLLAVPTMFAASAWSLYKERPERMDGQQWLFLSIGIVVSFLVALGVVNWLLRFVQTHTFIWFGVYRIIAAGVFWWLLFG